ncbi:hypothetical protein AAC387_Pa09g2337 [Persea americana]
MSNFRIRHGKTNEGKERHTKKRARGIISFSARSKIENAVSFTLFNSSALLLRSPKPIHFNCQFRNVVMISFKRFLFCRLQVLPVESRIPVLMASKASRST